MNTNLNHHIHLISHTLCPYVQRSVIVLKEKQIRYERTDINLNNKPQWFLRLSPSGKVPVLAIDQEHVIFESAVICEYLDEVTSSSLHPIDAIEKAKHRAWIEFGSQILNLISKLYNAPNAEEFDATTQALRERFCKIEDNLGDGPYYSGTLFCIIDAAFGPIFRYFDVFDRFTNLGIFVDLKKCEQWREALANRPSVQQAVSPDYPELLIEFVKNRQSHMSTLAT